MRVEIVTVGDELLLGETLDTNAAHLSCTLASEGIDVVRRTTVGDRADDIAAAVRRALRESDGVIVTGGLGPTPDDRTRSAIARLFDRELRVDERILSGLRARWQRLRPGNPFPESNAVQALVPAGATVLPNRFGTAPGLVLENENGRWVVMLPGVPREMRGMLAEELLPFLRRRGAGTGVVITSRTIRTTGIAESALAERLGDLARSAQGFSVAFLPDLSGVDVRVTARGLPEPVARDALDRAEALLRGRIGQFVYGSGTADLAQVILDQCRSQALRIAVAESCTGGMFGARLTAVPGSSDVFVGGIIAYDNSVKRNTLRVPADMLEQHGAVSEPVAAAMAESVCTVLGAQVGIGITGIAGPGGGTAVKPVGTVWIAVHHARTSTRHLRLPGDREEIRYRATQAALDEVRRVLAHA